MITLAAFTETEIRDNWHIWDLFQNGGVVLFRRHDILDSASENLRSCGYSVHCVDCRQTKDDAEVLSMAIVDSLGLPRYPRMNLDGFNDFISQIEFDNATGVIVTIVGFQQFQSTNPKDAFHMLDILALNHQHHMLRGNRLLTLVQSDDPMTDEHVGMVGGYKPVWNSLEWFHKDRGI